ncbi:MAG: hypothetical protein AAF471_07760, partial [Myxococcota bacterium]
PCYFLPVPTGAVLGDANPMHPNARDWGVPVGPRSPAQQTACTLIGEPRLQQGLPNNATQETARGFDPLAKKAFVVTADSRTCRQTLLAGRPALLHDTDKTATPRGGFGVAAETGRATPTAKTNKALAQAQVDSRFAKKQLEADTLTCTVLGDASLVPGEVLLLQCDAATVAGRWFVRETRHLGQGGAYTTELALVRNAAEPPKKLARGAAATPASVPKRAPVNRKPVAPKRELKHIRVAEGGRLVQTHIYE